MNEKSQSTISLLNAIIESTADGILVVSNDGRVLRANKKFQKLWNIPDSLLQLKDDKKLLDFILDQLIQPELFIKKVQELYSNPEEESYDEITFKDGRIYERYSTSYKMENSTLGRVWSFRDVTEQKRTEETLRKERILFRTIIDNLPDAIYAKDSEFKKTLANTADIRNMGAACEAEVIGKTDFEFFDPESAQAFYNDDKTIVDTGKPVLNREESFTDKEGHRNWLLTTKLPLIDSTGKITGIIGVGRDITLRKKNELIREALYDISEAVLITTDMYTLYKKIHEAVTILMPAKNFFIALYDDQKNVLSFPYMVDEYDPPFASKPLGNGLTEYVLRKGESVLIDAQKDLELRATGEAQVVGTPAAIWLGVPLKDEKKILGVIVVQDYDNPKAYGFDEMQLLGFISGQIAHAISRKRDAEAIEKYVAELNDLNKTKDKFFSIIAHDLKNPFVTLLGFSEILLSDFKELQSEEVLYYISEMKKSADLSHSLLQNLLQWSRSQTGKIEYHPQQLELKNIIRQNILLVKKSAEKKSINIMNNIQAELKVKADEDMLNTIVRNLLTNAIKFTSKDGIISVDASSQYGCAEIRIKDSGIGMDEETVNKLFRIDVTHSTSGTENETGTGLGLLLCKEFIEKHGGKIWVESKENVGSTFHFTLPQKE